MKAEEFGQTVANIEQELGKAIVGQKEVVRYVIMAMVLGGHILIEGLPGLGKTLLIKSLSQILSLKFSRIQFTPDLMPADILGTDIIEESPDGKKSFVFHNGPIFANLVLADEINRATPKTQSALLEAMQEKSVTIGDTTRNLDQPFFVMATQNPLEMEGTYPLPEAQLDRFMFKLQVNYPAFDELAAILTMTTANRQSELSKVVDGHELIKMSAIARDIPVASHVNNYIVALTLSLHPGSPQSTELANNYLRFGPSPRGAQAITLAAKINALLDNRFNVSFDDVNAVAVPCLRHRLIRNFEAEVESISTEHIIEKSIEAAGSAVKELKS